MYYYLDDRVLPIQDVPSHSPPSLFCFVHQQSSGFSLVLNWQWEKESISTDHKRGVPLFKDKNPLLIDLRPDKYLELVYVKKKNSLFWPLPTANVLWMYATIITQLIKNISIKLGTMYVSLSNYFIMYRDSSERIEQNPSLKKIKDWERIPHILPHSAVCSSKYPLPVDDTTTAVKRFLPVESMKHTKQYLFKSH